MLSEVSEPFDFNVLAKTTQIRTEYAVHNQTDIGWVSSDLVPHARCAKLKRLQLTRYGLVGICPLCHRDDHKRCVSSNKNVAYTRRPRSFFSQSSSLGDRDGVFSRNELHSFPIQRANVIRCSRVGSYVLRASSMIVLRSSLTSWAPVGPVKNSSAHKAIKNLMAASLRSL